ncbi:cell-division protein [Gracilibacillus halophilus YIM-C55.5]|uniref:Cell division protein FtsA n=1 Tax=Gracilibacillus halophilus YIM-C55.5 TaxID=1308866 RepID=N4WQB3_9BACI|nr:cell division protein FtsA [Gracilibacillus halophilus]ENH98327.1 cell-division protein [Gracilibacillus halophilus YIM-C55.5]
MDNSDILVSLDIGTSNVKVIIGEILEDSLNIIGVGSAKSLGMKKGAIVDIDQTVHSIRSAVEQAERMVDIHIDRVIVGINGNHVQLQPCHGVVAVSNENKEIAEEDIHRVMDAAQVISIPPEREIVDVIPQQFIVDGLDEIRDPRGMIGVRLEMEGTIITSSKTFLHNILKCVEKANLEIMDICLQPLATGEMALSKDEKNLGVALMDIGGGSTTVSVFENDVLVDTAVVPLGGDNITKDISIGLRTTSEEAEDIKMNYGHAFFDNASEEEMFDVNIIGSNQKQTFHQLDIAEIIEARLEEIYYYSAREIQKMGLDEIPGGIVLTGGSLNMPGASELAQDLFQSNVRIAIPDYIGVRDPQFTSGVGILKFAYKNAKIQGKEFSNAVVMETAGQAPVEKKKTMKEPKEPKKQKKRSNKEPKLANFFKYFFD